MVHTAVVVPAPLRDRLISDGQGSGRGLSGEIRQRLQMLDGLDHQTRKLVENTIKLTNSLARDLGTQWHEHDFARRALKAGFGVLLDQYAPERERATDAPYTGHPDDAPYDVIGQTHARIILRGHQGE